MKKLMMGLIALSVMAFGADLQKVTPQVQAANINFSKAKKITFVEAYPVQFTINVPVDLDKPIIGLSINYGDKKIISTKQKVGCYIADDGWQNGFYQSKFVEPGQQTITFKFNGIPFDNAMAIKKYDCRLYYETESGYDTPQTGGYNNYNAPIEDEQFYSSIRTIVYGTF